MDQNGNLVFDKNGNEINMGSRAERTRRAENALRQKAKASVSRDINQGNITTAEEARATSELTNNAVNKLAQEGKLNETTLTAMKEIAATANESAEKMARIEDEMRQIARETNEARGRNRNTQARAQMTATNR